MLKKLEEDRIKILWKAFAELGLPIGVLSEAEITRAEGLSPPGAKKFMQARSCLRILLGEYLNCKPQLVPIDYCAYGKPIVLGNPIYFNLSHAQDYVVYVFNQKSPVGIDLEWIRPRPYLRLVERYFTRSEIDWFREQTQLQDYFYRSWVCKEAYIKLTGISLLDGLKSLNTLPLLQGKLKILQTDRGSIQEILSPIGYRCALGWDDLTD